MPDYPGGREGYLEWICTIKIMVNHILKMTMDCIIVSVRGKKNIYDRVEIIMMWNNLRIYWASGSLM